MRTYIHNNSSISFSLYLGFVVELHRYQPLEGQYVLHTIIIINNKYKYYIYSKCLFINIYISVITEEF